MRRDKGVLPDPYGRYEKRGGPTRPVDPLLMSKKSDLIIRAGHHKTKTTQVEHLDLICSMRPLHPPGHPDWVACWPPMYNWIVSTPVDH